MAKSPSPGFASAQPELDEHHSPYKANIRSSTYKLGAAPFSFEMRILLVLIFSAITACADVAWPYADYTEIRGYTVNIALSDSERLIKDGTLNANVINKEGSPLTRSQRRRLLSAITQKLPLNSTILSRVPHYHGFVFYDSVRKPVACVEVCFDDVNGDYLPWGGLPVPFDIPALAMLCDELRLPNSPGIKFRNWYRSFCKHFNIKNTFLNSSREP